MDYYNVETLKFLEPKQKYNRIAIKLNGQQYLLTRREAQTLLYFAKGFSTKQISELLGLSPRTVDVYFESIKLKFNCKKRVELFLLLGDPLQLSGYLASIIESC